MSISALSFEARQKLMAQNLDDGSSQSYSWACQADITLLAHCLKQANSLRLYYYLLPFERKS